MWRAAYLGQFPALRGPCPADDLRAGARLDVKVGSGSSALPPLPSHVVTRLQRLLVGGQLLAGMWLGNAEIGGHPRIEKAGALQFVDAGKISRGVEAEMRQERLRRAVCDRSAGRAAATAYAHPL